MNDTEVEHVCESVREIHKESKIKVCVSGGLLNETQFRKLKQAGITRVHNNLETSRQNFPNVCTTHTYEDKIAAIRAAWKAGSQECIIIWRHPDRIFRMSVPLILMKTRSQRSAQLGKPE